MIDLFEQNCRTIERQSSKGNQLKWENNGRWYKADYAGYEGLTEYMSSHLLNLSSLAENEFVLYEPEQIRFRNQIFLGVSSPNFLFGDWQIITLQRLYKNKYGRSFYEDLWKVNGMEERFSFLVSRVEKMTGLVDFDRYLCKLFTIDAFFLNEDRHMHNIAVLMNGKGEFTFCPIFDNGAGLLSDTTLDYPIKDDVYRLMKLVHAKTFSRDFDEQLDVAEKAAGDQLKFHFTKRDVKALLDANENYDSSVKKRVETIIYSQMHKYSYMFS